MNELTVGHLFDWHNKTVAITGADNMLGTTLAHAFAYYRANVVLIDKNAESMGNIRRIIMGMERNCLTFPIDVEDEDRMGADMDSIASQCGVFDVLINLEGEHLPAEAALFLTRRVAEGMKKQGYGKIIHSHSSPDSKAELLGKTADLAGEYASYGVNVNAVSWNSVGAAVQSPRQTVPQIPIHRNVEPSDLVGAFLFLASSGADYITGQTLHIHRWS